MTRSKSLRFALLLILVSAIAMLPAVALAAGPPPAQGVRTTPIGHPTWRPVDFHLFSAPMGTLASGYAEFGETALSLLPEPNHVLYPGLLVGPGAPHAGPYDSELATGVATQGFHEGVRFSTSEFSNGEGVFIVWMTVPAPGTTGSSPDFASGPIIPNSLFPIHVEGTTTHNGQMFDPYLTAFDVPALVDVDPPFDVDGASHFPIFIADNADFGPVGGKLRGSYIYQLTMIDSSGNGWRIDAHFAVAP